MEEQTGISLLVVDDDDVDRERIRRYLNNAEIGSKIDESSNLKEAMTALSNKNYDCVIVDYRLGVEDGLDVLRAIRSTLSEMCAVIMVTGLGDEEVAAEALRLGANDYLIKNQLNPSKLLKSILGAVHAVEMNSKIHDLAHFDTLTGLVTRHLLVDRVQQVVAHIGRSEKIGALVFIDLDNFKPVNDLYGHESGDYVLVEIASRLRDSLRGTDTVSRIGGDEFVVLLAELNNISECKTLLHRVLINIESNIRLPNGIDVNVSASVGVTTITDVNIDADTLLRRADQAMYQAKNSGKNKFIFFDTAEEINLNHRMGFLSRVEKGIEDDEFVLYYQPKVNIVTGEFVGVEALIRWVHPEKGILAPIHFEKALSDPRIGVEIGEWVIGEAIRQYHIWESVGWNIKISVNISPVHIQINDFIERLDSLLMKHSYDVSQKFLEFEVLESVSIKDIDHSSKVLEQCKERGIKIALDDFGTAYASLTYLKLLPLDILKIDQSFVDGLESDKDNIAIVKSIIALGNAFGYGLIAEGVETASQAQKLVELGCSQIQGYLVSRPIPAENIISWLYETPIFKRFSLNSKCFENKNSSFYSGS